MVQTICAVNSLFDKECKFSSCVSKNGIFPIYGRSVSIFSANR